VGTSQVAISRGPVNVPAAFTGMHFNLRPFSATTFAAQGKAYNSHDAQGTAWFQIHTASGTFNWTALDAWVAALPNGASWTYCIWGTPSWCSSDPAASNPYQNGTTAPATDISAAGPLAAFVTALCQRYPTLARLEVWNEPDIQPSLPPIWWTGTVAQFITQTQTIHDAAKAVRSGIQIIGPCCTFYIGTPNWLSQFIAAGGLNYVDAVSLHAYQIQWPTKANPLLGICHALQYHYNAMSNNGIAPSSKDFYCTEFGLLGIGASLSDAEYIAAYKRGMLVAAAAGFKEANWYAYDDSAMGYAGRPAVEAAVAAFNDLLCGATVSACVVNLPELTVTANIRGTVYTI
jgi:hypothetical protein